MTRAHTWILAALLALVPAAAAGQATPNLQDYGVTVRFLEYHRLRFIPADHVDAPAGWQIAPPGALVLPDNSDLLRWSATLPETGEPSVWRTWAVYIYAPDTGPVEFAVLGADSIAVKVSDFDRFARQGLWSAEAVLEMQAAFYDAEQAIKDHLNACDECPEVLK